MAVETQFNSGTSHIFADLRLPNSEELLLKAELVQQISNLIDAQEFSSAHSVRVLSIDENAVIG